MRTNAEVMRDDANIGSLLHEALTRGNLSISVDEGRYRVRLRRQTGWERVAVGVRGKPVYRWIQRTNTSLASALWEAAEASRGRTSAAGGNDG